MEKENMLAGRLYDPTDRELKSLSGRAHRLSKEYGDTPEEDTKRKQELLDALLPHKGEGCYLQAPVYFDYGVNTFVGDHFYANFNLTVLDSCPVRIGNDVMIGPNCSIVTPIHPMTAEERRTRKRANGELFDLEYAAPITIGNDCWLASNVIVCAGVTIGDGCVIGAGSVVTRDIPPGSFAAGNPCRVIRKITEADSLKYKPEVLGDKKEEL